MKKIRIAALAMTSTAILATPGFAQLRTAPAGAGLPTQQASTPDFVTCSPYLQLMYLNGGLTVGCSDDKAPSNSYSFVVAPGNNPSIEQVIAFVQPYVMAVKVAQIVPSSGVQTMTPFQSFNQRIGFYLENGKIVGMRMMTSN